MSSVPETVKKPAGSFRAFALATTWLSMEYQNKVQVVQKWETAKLLINKCPCPDNLGTIVFGLKEYSIGEAVNAANAKLWGQGLLNRDLSAFDVVLLQQDVVVAMQSTINTRREEYIERVKTEGAASARKRRRQEVGEGGTEAHADDGSDGHASTDEEPGQISEILVPNDEDIEVGAGWGDEDEDDSPPAAAASSNGAKSEDLRDEMEKESETEMMKMKARFHELSKKIDSMQMEIDTLRGYIIDPYSVVVYNISRSSMETTETVTKKMKKIFDSLGLEAESKNIAKAERMGSALTVRVTFRDTRAVKEVLRSADRFSPTYWSSKNGGAAVIRQMNAMKKDVEIYAKNYDLRVQDQGWMKTEPWKFGRDGSGANAKGAKKPKVDKW